MSKKHELLNSHRSNWIVLSNAAFNKRVSYRTRIVSLKHSYTYIAGTFPENP